MLVWSKIIWGKINWSKMIWNKMILTLIIFIISQSLVKDQHKATKTQSAIKIFFVILCVFGPW